MVLEKRVGHGVYYTAALIGIAFYFFRTSTADAQGMMEVAEKVKGVLSKGRTAVGVAVKFVPCFKLVAEIQGNMKKVGYNAKGLRICLDRAIPKDEEIQGREDQMVTREELRTKVKNCITAMIAAARGKDDIEEDMLTDIKDCFMNAAQSLSALTGGDDGDNAGGEGHRR
ncbi:uncharacterized protein LOC111259888 [Varroa jacobsoni]|uniref:Uncharacterized protein n=1 Tax=Varroa destructor TaxID=109461 RepID=A0A7M7K6D5_VARDE|nr:uncharacterized protein LOC111250296 isoform X2 [Varroa destructor]XP_022661048.1 uncharacterized protein LOC111250296 isoform X2 [Varroa destructor]XP_022687978.1 uncharacterized protein LOC111259888 [Varroa jacobsoni]